MPTYGYIRTSRDQEPGHPGSDPHVQRRQLVEAGVDHARIYADVAASGAKDYNSRDQWHALDTFRHAIVTKENNVAEVRVSSGNSPAFARSTERGSISLNPARTQAEVSRLRGPTPWMVFAR